MELSSVAHASALDSRTPFRLITLGRTALITPAGEDADLGRRRRKLALLAVLALASEPLTRDELAQMFWGDEEPERARHSLSDALSHLRRVLGRDVISGRSAFVELRAEGVLSIDVLDLDAAFTRGAFADVKAIYGGVFLDNVIVEGSPKFEAWVVATRERYAALVARAISAETSTVHASTTPTVLASAKLLGSSKPRKMVQERSLLQLTCIARQCIPNRCSNLYLDAS